MSAFFEPNPKQKSNNKTAELDCDDIIQKMPPGFDYMKGLICRQITQFIKTLVKKMEKVIKQSVKDAIEREIGNVLKEITFDFKPDPKYIIKNKNTTTGGRRKHNSRKMKHQTSKRKTQKGGFGNSLASAIGRVANANQIEKYLNTAIYNANENDFRGAINHKEVTRTLLNKIGDATKDKTNETLGKYNIETKNKPKDSEDKNSEDKKKIEFKKILAKMIALEPNTEIVVSS